MLLAFSRRDFHLTVDRHFSAGCVFLVASICIAPTHAEPLHRKTERTQRFSVIDYFNLLPFYGIEDTTTPKERRELLQTNAQPIVDVRHDYLLIQPDSAPPEQIAVFRTLGQADLLAVSLPDSESDYNDFALYRLRGGKLHDVTQQMLPMPARTDRLLYELPRFGTTIKVFRFSLEKQSRRHAFDLQWRRGRFVKVMASKV